MKVIDLLNRIANGEEIKKFKYYDGTYIYDEETKKYWFKDMWFDLDFSNLNDEVEIIEEDKKIEKIEKVVCYSDIIDRNQFVVEYLAELKYKINEIIDKINKD